MSLFKLGGRLSVQVDAVVIEAANRRAGFAVLRGREDRGNLTLLQTCGGVLIFIH